MARKYRAAVNAKQLEAFASSLGASVNSLEQLQIGWDGQGWIFPMKNADGVVVGIRRRFSDGRKLSVKGGHDGLFIPSNLPEVGELLITEGPTDVAALLDMSFDCVVGRPSCTGGTKHVVQLARGLDVVIVADADEPGQRGADTLARELLLYCPNVRIITPPIPLKDARAWLRAGGTHNDVQREIDNTEARRLRIESR